MIRSVKIEVIPHSEHRYETVGDWFFTPDNEHLVIRVSYYMADWRHIMLVAVHELVEALLCAHRGISEAAVTAFDEEFDNTPDPPGRWPSDPGDDPAAPYAAEHCFATGVERLLASALDVKWQEYEAAIDKLGDEK